MSVYDYKVKNVKGESVDLSQYKGKVLIIANTASKCGFTPQYEGLEKLYKEYKDQGLVVLGFPSNQFLEQEPGTNDEAASFCKLNYGVTFPVFAITDVRGDNADPLFKYLSDAAPFKGYEEYYPENLEGNGIKWNFTKFLVSKDGTQITRFEPSTTPEEMEAAVKAAL